MRIRVKPVAEIVALAAKHGATFMEDGSFYYDSGRYRSREMWQTCGREYEAERLPYTCDYYCATTGWKHLAEWVEVIE